MFQKPFTERDDYMDTPTTAADIRALGLQPIPSEMLDADPWNPDAIEEQEDGKAE
jgi:hypothetical protein